jgi:hypothetical protein
MENNKPNSGGRETNVTEGKGTIKRREKVETGGPVGRQDGYSGRKDGGAKVPKSDSRYEGKRGNGLDLLGALIGQTASSSGNSANASHGNAPVKKTGIGKILIIALIAIVGIVILTTCIGGKSCSLLDMFSGMSDMGGLSALNIAQGYDDYDVSDATVTAAPVASTSNQTVNTFVASEARDKYTVIKGGGQDKVTIMVYMCGTDLESKYGMATNDLNEMLHATLNDDNVNIIVETGGTKTWKNSVISGSTLQRYRVRAGGLERLDDNVGRLSMTDPKTLTDFIKYCTANYPANRNMLIFWDHGGGSLSGYGYDQLVGGSSMTLDKINSALKASGAKFDFIGFDACLMATMETSLVTEQYADYLIGSEETEPGCGWYYTNWLTELSKDPSMPTVNIGKQIIDDFTNVCKKNNAGDSTTLSIVDLAEFHGTVPAAFSAFAGSVNDMLDGKQYEVVANARSDAREFGASARIDHVDLIGLASGIGSSEADALVKALKDCIKYNRTSRSMANAYGMSIYFPYTSFKSVNSAVSIYNAIGMDKGYTDCVKSFASLAAGGQIATGTTSSPMGSLFGNTSGNTSSTSSSDMLTGLLGSFLGGGGSSDAGSLIGSILGGGDTGWFDSGRVMGNLDYYDAHAIYADDMMLTEKNGVSVLHLSKEKWDMIENIQINVFYDDGEGYIDLGMDNVFRRDGDGDLVIEYDRTWVALNGQIVPYYMISDVTDSGNRVITGRVPAQLNGELVYLIVVFDDSTPETKNGYVAGARYIYTNGETDTLGRGLIKIKDGDKIDFVCDYYTYGEEYDASYLAGDTLVVSGDIKVSNVKLDDSVKCRVCYCLTDIYGNEFWTIAKEF